MHSAAFVVLVFPATVGDGRSSTWSTRYHCRALIHVSILQCLWSCNSLVINKNQTEAGQSLNFEVESLAAEVLTLLLAQPLTHNNRVLYQRLITINPHSVCIYTKCADRNTEASVQFVPVMWTCVIYQRWLNKDILFESTWTQSAQATENIELIPLLAGVFEPKSEEFYLKSKLFNSLFNNKCLNPLRLQRVP